VRREVGAYRVTNQGLSEVGIVHDTHEGQPRPADCLQSITVETVRVLIE